MRDEAPSSLQYPLDVQYPVHMAPNGNSSYHYVVNKAAPSGAMTTTHFGGALTQCTISPDLTAKTGLSLNTVTCEITGLPSVLSAPVTYTVRGSNGGNPATSTEIMIAVIAVASLELPSGMSM